jgi:hypothetical protein
VILRPDLISVVEGAKPALRARVYSADGSLLVVDDVDSIEAALYDLDSIAVDAPVLSAMFSPPYGGVVTALTVDGTWDLDSTGFNVKATVITDSLGIGGHMCRYEMRIFESSGEVHTIAWNIEVRSALGA